MSSSPPPTSSPSPPAASPPPVAASPPASSPPPAASSPPPTVTLSPPPVSSPPPVQPSPPVVSPPAPSVSNPPPPIVTPPATPVLPPPASSPPPATPVVTPPSSSSPPPAPPSRSPPSKSPPPAIPSVPPPPTSPSTPSTPSPPVTPSTPSTPSRGSPPSPPVATTNTPSTSVSRPPPSSSSSSSSVSIPVIVGIAGAAVALIAILSILVCCCRRKKRSYSSPSPPHGLMPMPPPRKEEMYGLQPQNLQHNFPPPEDHFVKIPPPAAPPVISSRNGSGSNYSAGDSKNPPQASGIALGYLKSVFTYEELAIATDGFSDANLLGQGGFGFVHRGVLSNGEEVAVKQLKSGSGQGEREFHAEVEIISRVHHKHLVSLVGYSTSGGKRLLVYEFVPNNTLEFHLHGKGRPTMDWPTRLKIALGSAKGLAYLHEDCHPKIIHRDIKAANILLDYNFEPKVADFGLAKFASEENTHVSTRVMGTFGYLSPEYAATGKLTDKSDVFSFGVMLLELITGRRPVDQTNTHMAESLVDWARPLLTKALEDNRNFDALVDPKLQNNYDAADMAHMVACAAAAVRHSARHRPRMSQIVRALEGDASLEELNDGVRPGQSSIYTSYSSSDYDDSHYKNMGKFRKLGLNSEDFAASDSGPVRTNSNGRPKDYRDTVSSDCSGGTSEYGQNPSGSSSEGVPSQEMELRMKNRASGS